MMKTLERSKVKGQKSKGKSSDRWRTSTCLLLSVWLLVIFWAVPTAHPQQSPIPNSESPTRNPELETRNSASPAPSTQPLAPIVNAVGAVGMTVSDMDRSVEFYSKVLSFEKMSDVEVWGTEYEHLQGLFGLRMRVVRMKLGDEAIELTEYLAPQGRPIPVDSRSHDRWFQHIALIVHEMDRAYVWLRRVQEATLQNPIQQ